MFFLTCLLLLPLLASSETFLLSDCYWSGTWHHDHVIQGVPGIPSSMHCQGLCYENEDCVAFTFVWQHANDDGYLSGFCYLFSETSSQVDCNDGCLSGPRECDLCSEEFSCNLSEDDFLTFYQDIPTETFCQYLCYSSSECSRYTWYSEDDPIFSKECYLLKSCNEPMSCDFCATGYDDCAQCFTLPDVSNGQ